MHKKVFKHGNGNNMNMLSESNQLSDVSKLYRIFKMMDIKTPKILAKSTSTYKYLTPTKFKYDISYYRYYYLYMYNERKALLNYGIIPRLFYSLLSKCKDSKYFLSAVLAPVLVNPCQFIAPKYKHVPMTFCYHSQVEPEFKMFNIFLPVTSTGYKSIANKLGLLYCKFTPQCLSDMTIYSRLGCGLRDFILQGDMINSCNSLVEVVTLCQGWRGRFIVLVTVGIGVVIWYQHYLLDGGGPQANVESLMPFFNINHYEPGFKKVFFIELESYAKVVESVLSTEYPFHKMDIPDEIHNPIYLDRRAIGLGIMLAFFISIGIYPNDINSVLHA